jgi:hypothetical protein
MMSICQVVETSPVFALLSFEVALVAIPVAAPASYASYYAAMPGAKG